MRQAGGSRRACKLYSFLQTLRPSNRSSLRETSGNISRPPRHARCSGDAVPQTDPGASTGLPGPRAQASLR